MNFIEQLGLQNPFLLLAPAAKPIDPVAQRAVTCAIEHLDDTRGKTPIRLSPGYPLVQIHQVALVDARRGRVDDNEHLSGKIIAAPIENDARHKDRFGFVGMRSLVESQRGQPVLPVNDQEFLLRFLEMTHRFISIQGLEPELLRRE